MSKRDYEHHVPRNLNKFKRKSRGFNENYREDRASKVNFKRYLRELKENDLYDDLDDDDYDLYTEGN